MDTIQGLFDGYRYTYEDGPELSCQRCGRTTAEVAIYTNADITDKPGDFGQYCRDCRDELREQYGTN